LCTRDLLHGWEIVPDFCPPRWTIAIDLEHTRRVIAEFIAGYDHKWIIERLGYRTPAQARQHLLKAVA